MSELLTAKQVSKMLSVGLNSVYQMIYANRIPYIILSKKTIRFDEEKITEWIKSNSYDTIKNR